MLGVDALREEDQPLHQKKSVSPSVNRQERGSGSSSPASGLPMKSSDIGVGTNPHEAYAAVLSRPGQPEERTRSRLHAGDARPQQRPHRSDEVRHERNRMAAMALVAEHRIPPPAL